MKSLIVFGRASRSEYWWFLPVGTLLPVATFVLLRSGQDALLVPYAFAWSCVAVLPLASVTMRRLHDINEGAALFNPPAGALVLLAMMWPLYASYRAWLDPMVEHGDGPGMILVVFVLLPMAGLFALLMVGVVLFGLFSGAALFGHMLLPSGPGPNRYGSPPEPTP